VRLKVGSVRKREEVEVEVEVERLPTAVDRRRRRKKKPNSSKALTCDALLSLFELGLDKVREASCLLRRRGESGERRGAARR